MSVRSGLMCVVLAFVLAACGNSGTSTISSDVEVGNPDIDTKVDTGSPEVGFEDDDDGDGFRNSQDNCPSTSNPEQKDSDDDGKGDACDPCPLDPSNDDSDGDELLDCADPCPQDGDNDADQDGVCGDVDNCPADANEAQEDGDEDGFGDVCDPCPESSDHEDTDNDGTLNCEDDCPEDPNKVEPGLCGCGEVDTADSDEDGTPDCLDPCPLDADDDKDDDGVCGDVDNCPGTANEDQEDGDEDGRGDVCDGCPNDPVNDFDDDLVCGDVDNCPTQSNPGQEDVDGDGIGDVCDPEWIECGDFDDCDDDVDCTHDQCVDGKCQHTLKPADCDDGNPCTDDVCDPVDGCVYVLNSYTCDDDNPCTLVDVCQDGVCVGQENECLCGTDADCEDDEDGDMCNGTLVCVDSICQLDPESMVTCDASADPCVFVACEPSTGQCVGSPAADGTFCDDESLCTPDDTCSEGVCVGTGSISCEDGNPCTDDPCDPTLGCLHEDNTEPCDDGDVCTDQDICLDGVCVGGGLTDCDDGNACTADACVALAGCVNVPITGPCSDGNACTVGDMCQEGTCQSGAPLECNDGSICTEDSCDESLGCVFAPAKEGEACDDGNACTSEDACTAGKCMGAGIACDDGDPCTDDLCDDPQVGCYHVNNAAPCEDGNLCTAGDSCSEGGCVSGNAVACDDGNLCTDDVCVPETGLCVTTANDEPCDDGDACTLDDTCALGACAPGEPMDCLDGDACTHDTCVDGACVHADRVGQTVAEVSFLRAVAVRTDGSYLLAGTTVAAEGEDRDAWTAQVLPDSTVAWSKSFGGDADHFCRDIAVGPNDSFVVTGSVFDDAGVQDGWLEARSSTGDPLWSQTYGTTRPNGDIPFGVESLPDGYIVVGYTWSFGAGKNDAWLVRTDLQGQVLWEKAYGLANKDGAYGVLPLNQGADGFAFSGTSKMPGYDSWLGVVGANGTMAWEQHFAIPAGNDMATSIARLPNGGFVLAGYGYTSSDEGVSFSGRILTTSSDGSVTADVLLGTPDATDQFEKVLVADDGDLLAGGAKGGNPGRAWIVRTDSSGVLSWEWVAEGGSPQTVWDMALIEEGGVLAVGSKNSQGFWTYLNAQGQECTGPE
jgi:hypothetical protein